MYYNKVHLIYFSPTHTSAKIAYAIAEGLGIRIIEETDLTYECPAEKIQVEDALAILAVPVYGGRVAETAIERLKQIEATNSAVIPIVLYGNRDYEDALIELRDFSIHAGFTPLAAAAFIGEHSYSRADIGMPIAANRPDDEDCAIAQDLGKAISLKLESISSIEDILPFDVKGNFPYKVKGASTPATPLTKEELCTQCGHCIEICPTAAIGMNDLGEVESDKELCIKCCACVKECPQEARIFDTPYTAMLFNNFKQRKSPELFI